VQRLFFCRMLSVTHKEVEMVNIPHTPHDAYPIIINIIINEKCSIITHITKKRFTHSNASPTISALVNFFPIVSLIPQRFRLCTWVSCFTYFFTYIVCLTQVHWHQVPKVCMLYFSILRTNVFMIFHSISIKIIIASFPFFAVCINSFFLIWVLY